MTTARPAVALIGGLDPTGGAGLLRDGWTASARAPSLRQLAVCTALTRQGQGGPARFASTRRATLARALERAAADPDLRAIKLGMIPPDRVELIADFLAHVRAHPGRPRASVARRVLAKRAGPP